MPNILPITDFSAPELDVYARLTEAQLFSYHTPDQGLFIAESPNVILRALNGGYEPVSLLLEARHVETQAREVIARCGDVPVYTSTLEVLKELTGFPLTRGVLCAMRRKERPSASELCRNARRIVVLDSIMNPTNVGAIFRSAAALHMDAVLLTHGCSDPLYRRAARVSMGTVFQIPWTYLPESDGSGSDLLHSLGFKTAALALREESLSIDDPMLRAQDKLALLLGSEGYGLSAETIAQCDYTVLIPMAHGVDSLNVAAASAVAFWELRPR